MCRVFASLICPQSEHNPFEGPWRMATCVLEENLSSASKDFYLEGDPSILKIRRGVGFPFSPIFDGHLMISPFAICLRSVGSLPSSALARS